MRARPRHCQSKVTVTIRIDPATIVWSRLHPRRFLPFERSRNAHAADPSGRSDTRPRELTLRGSGERQEHPRGRNAMKDTWFPSEFERAPNAQPMESIRTTVTAAGPLWLDRRLHPGGGRIEFPSCHKARQSRSLHWDSSTTLPLSTWDRHGPGASWRRTVGWTTGTGV